MATSMASSGPAMGNQSGTWNTDVPIGTIARSAMIGATEGRTYSNP